MSNAYSLAAKGDRSDRGSTPDGGRSINELLRPIQIEVAADWPIVALETASERAAWASTVYSALRSRPSPATDGRAIRNRVFKALSILAEHGTVTHEITPIVWKRLFQLAKLCAHEVDWTSSSGPLMGASNAKLELETWDRTNARRTLRELSRWGLIVPYCPKGNGHRNYRAGSQGAYGSGWSLAPLHLMIETLEAIAAKEIALKAQRVELPRQIQQIIYAVSAIVKPFVGHASWADDCQSQLNELRNKRTNAIKGSVLRLETLLSEALSFLEHVENLAITATSTASDGTKTSTRPDSGVQYQYSESRDRSVCNGNPDESSGDRRGTTRGKVVVAISKANLQGAGKEDAFGIVRSGFKWEEAPRLFPFHQGMIDLSRGPTAGSCEILARLLGISLQTAATAERRLGRDGAVLCLLMTGQMHAEDQILKTNEAYMRGMVRKAAIGELNIGHSLFGRRQERNHDA